MHEIGRKHPIHLDVHDRRDTPIIVFLTVCTKDRKPILASSEAHALLIGHGALRKCGRLAVTSFCLIIFIFLCARGVRDPAFVTVGQVLEIRPSSNLDKPGRLSDLATAFLGYAIAQERELRSEMAVRCRESSSGRVGCKVGRLVISGGVERTTMVTTLEGRALSRPKHKHVG